MISTPQRLIVGITGASGTIYGIRLLELLRPTPIETHLILTKGARLTLTQETDLKPQDVEDLADVNYSNSDLGAAVSSGSFRNMGMVIAPCSIRTLSDIANGSTGSLVSRAADVALKERRRVVLMVRETPLHSGHIRSMAHVTEAGAIVYPPVPAFYAKPATLDDLVNHTVGRVLDLFDIDVGTVVRWGGVGARAE